MKICKAIFRKISKSSRVVQAALFQELMGEEPPFIVAILLVVSLVRVVISSKGSIIAWGKTYLRIHI